MVREANARLRQLLEPVVTLLGYELVALEYFSQGSRSLLRVYIDTDEGIHVGDCEKVSHQISGLLDVEEPIKGQYTLEVSSPGLDRPLSKPAHFEQFRGQVVNIRLMVPVEGRRNFKGMLQGLQGEQVSVNVEGENILLPLDNIEKARLVPEI